MDEEDTKIFLIDQCDDGGFILPGVYSKALLIKTDSQGNTMSLGSEEHPERPNKILLRMCNLLGQEIQIARAGELVIYQFSDGSSEKRMLLP